MARASMAALITRVRSMINDPAVASQIFTDDQVQDICDESRVDVINQPLKPAVTYGPTIQYLNYYSEIGGWEADYVILQNLATTVTPSSAEPIAGKFTFATNTYPTLTITGKQHDVYHAAADLLELLAAQSALSYDINVNGQTLHRSQALNALLVLAKRYRTQQRPKIIEMRRSDISSRLRFDPTMPTFGDRTGL